MKHLLFNQGVWCDNDEPLDDHTEDPRDATCSTCLKIAAGYGAAAAMRYAAVEAGATRDPELVRERDEAIRKLNTFMDAVRRQRVFFCTSCEKLFPDAALGLEVGGVSWCEGCAAAPRKELHS